MISLVSWNINSVRARLPLLEAFLENKAPDILLLQETKVPDAFFPIDLFDHHHYNLATFGQKSYNGVSIASKGPLENVERLFFNCEGEARYIEAMTLGLHVGCVYVPNGQSLDSPAYQKKLVFLEQLKAHVRPFLHSKDPFCLAGDFNVAPYDKDVAYPQHWKNHVLCSEKERQAVRSFLYEGWTDVLDQEIQEKNPFTWWDYRGRSLEKGDGLRLDHCFLSPSGMDQNKEATVGKVWRTKERPSDHAPIWVTFR